MPQYDQDNNETRIRALAYGPAKHKKTWWAANAAKYGYNVIFIDGDDGTSIIRRVDDVARKRIYRVNVLDDTKSANMCVFVTKLFKQQEFIWNETQKISQELIGTAKDGEYYFEYDKTKLTDNDIIVFDSWTALTRSLLRRYYIEQKKDFTNSTVIEADRGEYRWTGAMADWMLEQLKTFPCHLIVIAHEQSWEKRDKDDQNKIVMQRMQAVSTSNNQSMRLAKYFSDILYFTATGEHVYIDTRISSDRDGGCRNVKPGRYAWDDCQFNVLAEGAGYKSTGAALEAFKFLNGAELKSAHGKGTKIALPSSSAAGPIEGGATKGGSVSITDLMGKM